jgi:hypothetical protein
METQTKMMTITDDGYLHIAMMFSTNVIDAVRTRKDWGKDDASELLIGVLDIVRTMPDDNFELLKSNLKSRYDRGR